MGMTFLMKHLIIHENEHFNIKIFTHLIYLYGLMWFHQYNLQEKLLFFVRLIINIMPLVSLNISNYFSLKDDLNEIASLKILDCFQVLLKWLELYLNFKQYITIYTSSINYLILLYGNIKISSHKYLR